MPDLPQPFFQPELTPDWMDAQRKQQMAQMLMGSLQQANQTPDNWNSMKVVPKRGMAQNLSVLADALMAKKGMDASQQATSDYYGKLYGSSQPQQGTPTGPGAGIVNPNAPPDQQAAAQAVTNMPPSTGLVQPPQNPLIPPGMTRQQATMVMNMPGGPQELVKRLMGTPEYQTALSANNGNAQAAMAQLRAEANVKGTLHLRQGEDAQLPNGQTIRNPVLGPGEMLTRDAQGNPASVALIPGAADAAGTLKAVQTASDVANTPRMVPQGGGSERLMYPGDPNGPGLPPALRTGQPDPSVGQPGQPPQRNSAPAPIAPQTSPALTSSRPSLSATLPQKDSSGILSNNLWSDIPKMQIPSTPGQTTNAYQQKIIDSSAAKHQELVNKFGDQSAAGVQQLEYLTAAEKSLPSAEVGPMSEWLTHNRGVLVQQFPQLAGALGGDKVTPTLELNKQLTNAALQGARSTFGSRMTQNEVNLQKDEMSPNPGMTRDALASLINQAKMKAAYGIQQDKDYSDYHASNGDPNRFESQYNVKRPITRFASQYATPPAALDRLKQQPGTLPDFKARYGWDPTQ